MISYTHLVNHIVPGPQSFSYFIPFLLIPIPLLISPARLSHRTIRLTVVPIIIASSIHAWIAMGAVDVISVDNVLWSLFLFVARDPRKDFKRLVKRPRQRKSESPTHDEVPYPSTLSARLPWVGSLLISLRLTNWKINDRTHDSRQPSPTTGQTHFQFIRSALLRFILGYIALDLSSLYITTDAYFTDATISIFSPLPSTPYAFLYSFFPPLLWRSFITATQTYSMIANQYHLPLIPLVLLHYYNILPDSLSPHLWPSYFGPVTSILDNGLAGFWGTYWHQVMRWTVSGCAPLVADFLGCAKKSTTRFAVVLFVAFFNSGVVHAGLVPREPLGATRSVWVCRLLIAGFFWIQPLGIIIEVVGRRVLGRVVPGDMGLVAKRTANLAWIVCWSCVSFPLLGELARQLGWTGHYVVPLSGVRYLAGLDWVMWPCLRS